MEELLLQIVKEGKDLSLNELMRHGARCSQDFPSSRDKSAVTRRLVPLTEPCVRFSRTRLFSQAFAPVSVLSAKACSYASNVQPQCAGWTRARAVT